MSWVLRGSRLSITWGRLRHPPESHQAGGGHRWEHLGAFRGEEKDRATPGCPFSPRSTSSPSTNPLPSREKHPAAWRPARRSESSQMPLNNRQNILLNISAPAQRDGERPRRARAATRLLPARRRRRGRSGPGLKKLKIKDGIGSKRGQLGVRGISPCRPVPCQPQAAAAPRSFSLLLEPGHGAAGAPDVPLLTGRLWLTRDYSCVTPPAGAAPASPHGQGLPRSQHRTGPGCCSCPASAAPGAAKPNGERAPQLPSPPGGGKFHLRCDLSNQRGSIRSELICSQTFSFLLFSA